MQAVAVHSRKDWRAFYQIEKDVYRECPQHRSTEHDLLHSLVEGPTSFHEHAVVLPHILTEGGVTVGRFALIRDSLLPDYIQMAFFEALPGLRQVSDTVLEACGRSNHRSKKCVVGLNGHLNYGAGILLNHFHEVPPYGLPYSPPYYQEYFKDFEKRLLVTFHYPMQPFYAYYKEMRLKIREGRMTVRPMNKLRFRRDIGLYTWLNNACFQDHPYWADRTAEEDYELFHSFRHFMKAENLLFAEMKGRPVGFVLWLPDFHQSIGPESKLRFGNALKSRLTHRITACRFCEIAVLPQHRRSLAAQLLIHRMLAYNERLHFTEGEGGFIFEENSASMELTQGLLKRAFGKPFEPYRRYAVFEHVL
ncbi:hypothetical protein JW906_13670 [bacterium]|nr:hypothetical protein [bacterium]